MSFLYSILLKLLYPTSLCLVFLALAGLFRKRKVPRRVFFVLAIAVMVVCGNGWIIRGLTKHLEWQYLPPKPVPEADAILILGGGTLPPTLPRPSVEVSEAGNRLLYGAYLFRKGRAPRIICTGNVATGGLASRPQAADMAELIETLGIPKEAVITELKAEDTHQHGVPISNLFPLRPISARWNCFRCRGTGNLST
jgi:uncharacterized SAM-binding protein YcdF (DUF218 family)